MSKFFRFCEVVITSYPFDFYERWSGMPLTLPLRLPFLELSLLVTSRRSRTPSWCLDARGQHPLSHGGETEIEIGKTGSFGSEVICYELQGESLELTNRSSSQRDLSHILAEITKIMLIWVRMNMTRTEWPTEHISRINSDTTACLVTGGSCTLLYCGQKQLSTTILFPVRCVRRESLEMMAGPYHPVTIGSFHGRFHPWHFWMLIINRLPATSCAVVINETVTAVVMVYPTNVMVCNSVIIVSRCVSHLVYTSNRCIKGYTFRAWFPRVFGGLWWSFVKQWVVNDSVGSDAPLAMCGSPRNGAAGFLAGCGSVLLTQPQVGDLGANLGREDEND